MTIVHFACMCTCDAQLVPHERLENVCPDCPVCSGTVRDPADDDPYRDVGGEG